MAKRQRHARPGGKAKGVQREWSFDARQMRQWDRKLAELRERLARKVRVVTVVDSEDE